MSHPTLNDIAEWAESNGCVTGLAGAPSEECVAHVGLRLLHAYISAACKEAEKFYAMPSSYECASGTSSGPNESTITFHFDDSKEAHEWFDRITGMFDSPSMIETGKAAKP